MFSYHFTIDCIVKLKNTDILGTDFDEQWYAFSFQPILATTPPFPSKYL